MESRARRQRGVTESDLRRRIRNGALNLHGERGDKVDAPEPYDGFKYVFISPEGTNASVTTITLPELIRLCSALSSSSTLSPGLDVIFQRYTGFSAHDTALVDKQKASGRFILLESLKKMQEAEREANAESKGSSRSMGGKERAATANESAANCASSNGVGSTPRSASTNNPAPNNCTAREKRVCIGLNKYRIGEFVDSNKDGAQYCHAQGWTFFRSAWRAGDCRIHDQSDGGTKKWYNYACGDRKLATSPQRNIHVYFQKRMLPWVARLGRQRNQQSLLPLNTMLSNQIVGIYHRNSGDVEKILSNEEVNEGMKVLQCRDVHEVDCFNGYKIFNCPGLCGGGKGRCGNLDIVKVQKNNADLCRTCRGKSKREARKDRRRVEAGDSRTDPSSTAPFSCLTAAQSSIRHKKMSNVRKVERARLKRIKKKIEEYRIKFEGVSDEFEEFRAEMEEKLRDCVDNQQDFKARIKSFILEIMAEEKVLIYSRLYVASISSNTRRVTN